MKITTETVQKSKKDNGSAKMAGMMAKACAEQGDVAPNQEMIAVAAYFRAEQSGFAPGNEMDDWLQAEAEYKAGLNS
ncbi:MAG: DUF2934 domain-containing protein [Proteobacteria bacterium]|nr:DUF2934 domain-containing protein [Pseudomonadota bacterium]